LSKSRAGCGPYLSWVLLGVFRGWLWARSSFAARAACRDLSLLRRRHRFLIQSLKSSAALMEDVLHTDICIDAFARNLHAPDAAAAARQPIMLLVCVVCLPCTNTFLRRRRRPAFCVACVTCQLNTRLRYPGAHFLQFICSTAGACVCFWQQGMLYLLRKLERRSKPFWTLETRF
jgi:hypothetical protein